LGFKPEFTVIQGLNEIKKVFESGIIKEINDKKYSNIMFLKEKDIHA